MIRAASQPARWIRSVARGAAWAYRRSTAKQRALPDFIIIGTQKGGTTSLFRYLGQHPDLFASFTKEVHYFDGGLDPNIDTFALGEDWYRAHFAKSTQRLGTKMCFEASPLYLFNPLVPGRISELLPQVKMVAILRDPVERAISHYFHEERKGREPLPIAKALDSEESRLEQVLEQRDYKNRRYIDFTYKSRGIYHEQLKRYYDLFPQNNLLVLTSESLFTKPQETLRRVLDFVGADAGFTIKNLKPRNIGSNRTEVDPVVYEHLKDFFRPHNEKLYALVGEDYGWS